MSLGKAFQNPPLIGAVKLAVRVNLCDTRSAFNPTMTMTRTNLSRVSAIASVPVLACALLWPSPARSQGSLTPPGAPAPTMKTLQQIEPRTPISSLPFAISNSGSYYLTTNLSGAAGADGITIAVSGVTLDLGGFVLAGAGTNNGVNVAGNRTNLVVRNGAIRNWGICVEAFTSDNCSFERLRLSEGRDFDLDAGDHTVVDSCEARASKWGLSVNNGSTIRNCIASTNLTGFYGAIGCTFVDCTAQGNNRGIEGDEGCTIKGCTVTGSAAGDYGILAAEGSTVIGCTVEGCLGDGISLDRSSVKDCTLHNITGNAISLFINCHVLGNTCVENTGNAIKCMYGGHSIVGNTLTGNGRGISANPATGSLIIQNRASGNATNYDIAAGNTAGPIVTSANIATSSNPHANYSY